MQNGFSCIKCLAVNTFIFASLVLLSIPKDVLASSNKRLQIGVIHNQSLSGLEKGGGGIAVARLQGMRWYPACLSKDQSLKVPAKTFRLLVVVPREASFLVRREGEAPRTGKLRRSKYGQVFLVLDNGRTYQIKLLSPVLFGL